MKKYGIYIILWALWLFISFGIYLIGYVQWGLPFIPPHYHANFAVYVNGERIDFSGDDFMEDIAWCSLTGKMLPKDRAHLHENNQDTIHIHHEWVSWGHFFANIWVVFWDDFIATTDQDIFVSSQTRELVFILNGEQVENPFNELINSKDKLLIAYGEETPDELQSLFENVSSNAGEYNSKYDPGSCGGTNENAVVVLLRDKLTSIFWEHNH